MKKYFAYGSNMPLFDMQSRCPDAKPLGAWTLPDHKLYFAGVADVVPCDGNDVVGVLWEISQDDEWKLDYYEGYPLLYEKYWYEDVLFYRMTEIVEDPSELYLSDFYVNTMLLGYDNFDIDRTTLFRNMGYPIIADCLERYRDGQLTLEEATAGSGMELEHFRGIAELMISEEDSP